MLSLVLLALTGAAAQLVDGSLGMGYGVTSATLLLVLGTAPALASASIHLAEIGTTAASGLSHWRLGNVHGGVLLRIAVPGAVGAFLGAVVLTGLATATARPAVATLLLALGVYLVVRFLRPLRVQRRRPPGVALLAPLGLTAGFVDASGGGGWGPIATPALLVHGAMQPRQVVGTVNAAEFLVSLAASAGFLVALGRAALDPGVVVPLLLGGLLAAPVAATVVSRAPATVLATAVGAMLVVTNLNTVLSALDVPGTVRAACCVILAAVGIALVFVALRAHRATRGALEGPRARRR